MQRSNDLDHATFMMVAFASVDIANRIFDTDLRESVSANVAEDLLLVQKPCNCDPEVPKWRYRSGWLNINQIYQTRFVGQNFDTISLE